MDTTYYRKIAEIVARDDPGTELAEVASRVLSARNPRKADKKKLKTWMYTWIDRRLEVSRELNSDGDTNCRVPGGEHRYVDNVCIWCDAEQGV
jgi:hypothetical protein